MANSVQIHYPAEEIAKRVSELGMAIRRDAGSGPILLISILKGTAVFLADLLRAIPGSVSYQFVDVIQDSADTEIADATEIDFLTHFNIHDRKVYLLKDVVTSGVIETYLLAQFRQKKPSSLKLVALLDRPNLRTSALDIDFRLFEVESGTFVGYGLEYLGEYGNLPYIGTVETGQTPPGS